MARDLIVCDRIHLNDHSSAVRKNLTRGRLGETHPIGADGERDNVTVLRDILRAMDRPGDDFDWMRDRPGRGRRCAINASKLRREPG